MRMKSLLRRYSVLLALLVYWVPNAQTQNLPTVKQIEIRHVGPPATSDELIKSNIRVKVGDPITRVAIDDDVRNLYATGFFYNIRVAEEAIPEGTKLVYVVMGKLTLTDIRFEGNEEMSLAKLKRKVTSKVGEPLDEQKLFKDAQELKKLYQKSGFQKTEVEYKVIPNEATGRGTVTFKIAEAPKIRVDEVYFSGAEAFKQKKLRKTIKTRERWFMSWLTGSGTLKDEQFEDDKEKLGEFYRENGYIDFQIKDVKFDQVTDRKVAITFEIFEGRLYKTGNVEIKGNSLFPTEDITKRLKMLAGENFTPGGLNKDTEAIRDFYGEKGYIDTVVTVRKTPNVETGNMDLVYQIEELDKSFIEKIEIKGNVKTKDKVIRRELAVAPGEVFDMVGVKLSQKRLEGLDYFSKVDARPEPTDVPNRKNLVVGVEEKNTGNFTIGAGFSSVDAVVGFAEVTQGNFDLFNPPYFTGGGQKFRLRTQIGTERQDYQVSFTEPWFLDRKLAFGVDLYHRDLGYLSDLYDQQQTGAKLSLTRALGSDFLIGTLSYTIENIRLYDMPGLIVISAPPPAMIAPVTSRSVMRRAAAQFRRWACRSRMTRVTVPSCRIPVNARSCSRKWQADLLAWTPITCGSSCARPGISRALARATCWSCLAGRVSSRIMAVQTGCRYLTVGFWAACIPCVVLITAKWGRKTPSVSRSVAKPTGLVPLSTASRSSTASGWRRSMTRAWCIRARSATRRTAITTPASTMTTSVSASA